MNYILYNLSSSVSQEENMAVVDDIVKKVNDSTKKDIIKLNLNEFFASLKVEDNIYIVGGDGTLNHFVNNIDEKYLRKNKIFYYPSGTGNDFYLDVIEKENKQNGDIILINKYLVDLPVVEINGKVSKFINGIGFGVDGYCCEVADKLKAKGVKKINYTAIAIKGLLFFYKRVKAIVKVDGVEHFHKHVWIAPTMNGKYYGGGMAVAPNQQRINNDKTFTTVIFKGKSKLHTLMVFPNIFKGTLAEHKKMVSTYTGKEIEVKFSRPTSLQIDGETVLGVTSYKVRKGV